MRDDPIGGARVLVTGATGFIGRRLVERLVALGCEVHGTGRAAVALPGATSHAASLDEPEAFGRLAAALRPEVTFHLAAATERARRAELLAPMVRHNVLPVAALCEALVAVPRARLVLVGSAEDYGAAPGPWRESAREEPVSPYGVSKVAAAHVALAAQVAFGLGAVVARPSVVYGPGQRGDHFLPGLIATCLFGGRFAMTPGEQLRDFLYIDDLVAGLLALATRAPPGRIFNLASGAPVRLVDVACAVQKLVGRGELAVGALPYRPAEAMAQEMSVEAARALGWQAEVALDEGLRRTVAAAKGR
jgi:nucleoside-diphosphate-sugar epimerase